MGIPVLLVKTSKDYEEMETVYLSNEKGIHFSNEEE